MMKENINITIMKQACDEMGYKHERIAKGMNYFFDAFRVTDSSSSRSFVTSAWSLYPVTKNWHASIMKYKDLTNAFLKHGDFKTIPGQFFSFEEDTITVNDIDTYILDTHSYPVIIKPNDKSLSKGVQLLTDKKHLQDYINQHAVKYPNLLVQEYIHNQDEYRIFIYKGEIQFMYKYVGTSLVKPAGDKKYFLQENFPPEAVLWAKQLYQYSEASIIGADVFTSDNFKSKENITVIELNHNAFMKVIYGKYNEQKLAVDLWKRIMADYFSEK